MMNTLQEEEESKITTEDSDSKPSTPEPPSVRRISPFKLNDLRKMSESSVKNLSEGKAENGRSDKKSEFESSHRAHRRPSTFETVLQVLRRPSTAADAFRRGSNSRRGSHVNPELGRRPSHGSTDFHIPTARSSENSLPGASNRGLVVPTNHVSFRRPSGVVTFNPELMNPYQKRYIMGLLGQGSGGSNTSLPEICQESTARKRDKPKQCLEGDDAFVSMLTIFYANFLFFIGIAFPATEVISNRVPTHYYQGFYLYLYLGSLFFMAFMYMTLLRDRAIMQLLKQTLDSEEDTFQRIQNRRQQTSSGRAVRYGSFYLRLGAVAFGIGSMVYSGLEFGQYFELKEDSDCHNIVLAITPVTRMVLTLVQMQFIFLNSRQLKMARYRGIARFGLMHMVATNLCEWLNVIIEETKHEIIHIVQHEHSHHNKREDAHDIFECRRGNVMGSLVQDASPFLFPCTIEYSLICAVICYEMWKTVNKAPEESRYEQKTSLSRQSSKNSEDIDKSNNHFSVDCSNAHKGLFSGILLLVITIISLIMFFVMNKDTRYHELAITEIHVWELIMYILMTIIVVIGGWRMRYLPFKTSRRRDGIGLDNTLLMLALTGVYIHSMFSSIACFFMLDLTSPAGIMIEVLNLIQSITQTVFILDATFRRSETADQAHNKPSRQIITFLLVSNMALWLINTLQKSRAEFRPTHSIFFGVWAWTIITHVSMPLAIFFRFHSTICLFEVWKNAYKCKSEPQQAELLSNSE